MTRASHPLVSAALFRLWLRLARPGEQLEYHRGLLISDRSSASELPEDQRRALAAVADAAWEAAERGGVLLAQRRNAEFEFSYLAIRSSTARQSHVAARARPLPLPTAA